MFRRLSKTFNRKKDGNKDGVNGHTNGFTNGTYGTNGTNGTSSKSAAATDHHASNSSSDHDKAKESSATREDVQGTFEQFAQLIHAAQRPLPNQTGNGAYMEKAEPTGLWADLRSLGLKDVKTIKNIMEDKASGAPQDDKKMHMEQIIQVCKELLIRLQSQR